MKLGVACCGFGAALVYVGDLLTERSYSKAVLMVSGWAVIAWLTVRDLRKERGE